MRLGILFCVLIGLSLVSAGSISISPAVFKQEFFEPNLKKTYRFRVWNSNQSEGIRLFLQGDLKKYATIDKDFFLGTGNPTVTLNLPQKLNKPGPHVLFFVAREEKKIEKNAIGSRASVRVPIRFFVPYPGIYIESEFNINDINEGEQPRYEIKVHNLGSQDINIKPTIKIFSENGSEIYKEVLNKSFIKSKESLNLNGVIDSSKLLPGSYKAVLELTYYGGVQVKEKKFRVGSLSVEIIKYDNIFIKGKINPFNIIVASKWNSKINEIYAEITVTKNGVIVDRIKTPSFEVDPWGVVKLTGFLDATKLEEGKYLANIFVKFDGAVKNKVVVIYIGNEPTEKDNTEIYYYIIGVLLALLITIFVLYLRERKIRKNAEKKRR